MLGSHVKHKIDELFSDFARTEHVPGMLVGIVRGRELIHTWSHGYADLAAHRMPDAQTLFRIASMTKSFTALAILALRDEGKLALDDPAAKYVEDLKYACFDEATTITIRDLVAHTAGLVNDDPWADRKLGMSEEALSEFIRNELVVPCAVRTGFEYSNVGYALLGRIISVVAGRTFQQFIRERILDPLGMTETTFDFATILQTQRATGYRWNGSDWQIEVIEPDGALASIGGLATNAAEYARYLGFLLSAWADGLDVDRGPIRRQTVQELAIGYGFPFVPQGASELYPSANIYGHGLIVGNDRRIGRHLHHAGGLPGFGSHMLILPDSGLGVFSFANRTYAQPHQLNKHVSAILLDAGFAVARHPVVSDALEQAAAAVKLAYHSGSIHPIVEVAADNLLADCPVRERDAELTRLKRRFGSCRSLHIHPTHQLAGRAVLACERGKVYVEILLAPTTTPSIQKLNFDGGVA